MLKSCLSSVFRLFLFICFLSFHHFIAKASYISIKERGDSYMLFQFEVSLSQSTVICSNSFAASTTYIGVNKSLSISFSVPIGSPADSEVSLQNTNEYVSCSSCVGHFAQNRIGTWPSSFSTSGAVNTCYSTSINANMTVGYVKLCLANVCQPNNQGGDRCQGYAEAVTGQIALLGYTTTSSASSSISSSVDCQVSVDSAIYGTATSSSASTSSSSSLSSGSIAAIIICVLFAASVLSYGGFYYYKRRMYSNSEIYAEFQRDVHTTYELLKVRLSVICTPLIGSIDRLNRRVERRRNYVFGRSSASVADESSLPHQSSSSGTVPSPTSVAPAANRATRPRVYDPEPVLTNAITTVVTADVTVIGQYSVKNNYYSRRNKPETKASLVVVGIDETTALPLVTETADEIDDDNDDVEMGGGDVSGRPIEVLATDFS